MSQRERDGPPLERQIELRHLRMVDAIAATGSVSRAAERLFLSQPALSHALRGLEARLAGPLFERGKHGMVPTELGDRFVATAREVLAAIARLDATLRADGPVPVRVSTQCYTAYPWLPAALEALGPGAGVIVEIVPDAACRPLGALLENEIDLAIVHESPGAHGLPGVALGRDELVAVAARGSGDQHAGYVRPQELENAPVFLHTAPQDSALVRDFLRPAGVQPTNLQALQYTDAVLDVVSRGLGVSIVSRWLLHGTAADAFELRSLGPNGLHRDWWLAGRPGSWDTPAVRRVVELVLREMRPLMQQPHPLEERPGG